VSGIGLVALACLPGTAALGQQVEHRLGRLDWGNDPTTGEPWTTTSLTARLATEAWFPGMDITKARLASGESFPVVTHIAIAGRLPGQPEFDESVRDLREAKTLVPLALCAQICEEPLRSASQISATDGVFRWMRAYAQPSGNPIDQGALLPVVLATDLLQTTWTAKQEHEAAAWMKVFLETSDLYRERELHSVGQTPQDNFETWRLMMAMIVATVEGDRSAVDRLSLLWHEHLAANIGADGRTWDMRRRGSLHYQTYDLEPMIWVRLLVPSAFSAQDDALLKDALFYLKPYVEGAQTYIEFARPDTALAGAVAFDQTRRNSGMSQFQQKPWSPTDAAELLQLARCIFPTIAGWSEPQGAAYVPAMVHLMAWFRMPIVDAETR
jgi:hypothetical protein